MLVYLLCGAVWIDVSVLHRLYVLFVWLISRIFLVNEQHFSLTTNQSTVLSAMAYQPSEQGYVEG